MYACGQHVFYNNFGFDVNRNIWELKIIWELRGCQEGPWGWNSKEGVCGCVSLWDLLDPQTIQITLKSKNLLQSFLSNDGEMLYVIDLEFL